MIAILSLMPFVIHPRQAEYDEAMAEAFAHVDTLQVLGVLDDNLQLLARERIDALTWSAARETMSLLGKALDRIQDCMNISRILHKEKYSSQEPDIRRMHEEFAFVDVEDSLQLNVAA